MKIIIFHREEGWYPTEYLLDHEDWQAEADRNPGTLKITTLDGEILWELNSTP